MSHSAEGDGVFKIAKVGRGRGVLTARPVAPQRLVQPLDSAAVLVNTGSGSISGVRIVLAPGTPVVLEPKITRGERYLVTVTDDAGTPWLGRAIWGPWPLRLQLPAGSYLLRLFDDKGARSSTQLTVGSTPVRTPIVP
jgi:hypothetical protein